jgi:hypothetical protein
VKASEMTALIGRTGTLNVAGSKLRFAVLVTDVRRRYGNTDYLVTPISGSGEAWHASALVTRDEVDA